MATVDSMHLIRNPWDEGLVGWFPNIWVIFELSMLIVGNYTSSIWIREFPESMGFRPFSLGLLLRLGS